MPTTISFNNTSYSIPLEGELNWSTLSDFLVAVGNNSQTTNKQKIGVRVATASPVTVLATTDCVIITDLTIAGAVAVNLPAGATGQVFTIIDGKGDAGTNNITVTPAAGTINGAATYVIDSNRAGVTLVYNGTSWTVIAEFISSGDIPRNQIASGTANHVIINDGSGDLSSEATLAQTRGGMATDASVLSDGYVKKASGNFTTGAIAAGDLPSNIDATKIANGTVDNTEFQYLNGVTSAIQTQLGAKADGAASSTNNAIARFDLATGKVLKNSTVTVDDTGTVAGVNDITPTTINSVAMANYLTTSNTKAVTNKDIDGGTASNTNRITIPKDTKTNLDALTRKEGTLVYASDLDKLYADDGSTLKEIGSGGSGINYLADYFTADTLGTVGNGNVTDTGNRSSGTFSAWQSTNTTNISLSVSGASPLRAPNCYLFTGSGNNASGTTFVESPAFQLHVADLGKAVMVSFDLADVTADGNFDVCMVRYNSSGTYQEKISIAGNASGATPASAKLPLGVTKFSGFFISSATSTDYYALRIRRLAGTDVPRMDSIKVSPDTVIHGAAVTDWQSYTPTWTASSVNPSLGNGILSGFWRRVGDTMNVQINWNPGSTTTFGTGVYYFTIPSGYTIDTAKIGTSTARASLGNAELYDLSGNIYQANVTYFSTTQVALWPESSGNQVGNATPVTWVNNDNIYMEFNVPISGWSSSVTVANRAVEEFASSTTGTWDAAAAAGNTVYGISGSPISGSLSADRAKVVRFQTPIQPTDRIVLEILQNNTVDQWVDISQTYAASLFTPTVQFGAQITETNSTDVTVTFRQYAAPGTTYNSTTGAQNWSAGSFTSWRLRKTSGGASIGFPVSTANVVGRTDGLTVPSGYIGEIIAQERLSSASLNGTATTVAVNITASPLVLTPGNWLITANVNVDVSSAQVTTWQMSVSKTSATHNTYYGAPVSGEITAKRTLGSGFLYTDNQSVTYPYSVTASTTLYLVASCTFASGTNTQLSGRIQAVRIS